MQSSMEPAWLQQCSLQPPAWQAVIATLEQLTIQVAACECLLEDKHNLIKDSILKRYFSAQLLPMFKLLWGSIAANCARLADAVDGKVTASQVRGYSCSSNS